MNCWIDTFGEFLHKIKTDVDSATEDKARGSGRASVAIGFAQDVDLVILAAVETCFH